MPRRTVPATTTSQRHHRRDIQGLRALAVVLVVLYHSGLPVPGGFVGVDVFFVVSGFVITQMLLRELRARGSIDYARFYRRRVRRLLPALALVLLVVAIASLALLGPLGQQELTTETGVAATLFVANIQLIASPGGYFAGAAETNPLLHTWSLSVEEQFYLFLPVFMAVGWRLARKRKTAINLITILAVSLVAASFISSYNLSTSPIGDLGRGRETAFYSSLTRVWEFGIGSMLALVAGRLGIISRSVRTAFGVLGLGLIISSGFVIGETTPFPGWLALLPVLGAALVLSSSGQEETIGLGKILSVEPAVWIGDRSYSWYLWHWPMIVFAQTLWPGSTFAATSAAVLSLAPAAWSYRYVEQPIRFGQRFPQAGGLRIATACIALPLAAFATLALASAALREMPRVTEVAFATRHHIDAVEGCDGPPTTDPDGFGCIWPTSSQAGTVYLVGDSNAGQFSEPLIAAAAQADYTLSVSVRSACPLVDVALFNRSAEQTQCTDYLETTMAAITADPPDVVVVAAASNIYINQGRWEIVDPATGRLVGDRAGKAELWQAGLAKVLQQLHETGAKTIVVNPIPHFFADHDKVLVDNCPAFRLLNDVSACGATEAKSYLRSERSLALEAELAAVATTDSASSLDLFDQVCPGTTCTMYQDDDWLYRDGTHLSVAGSTDLTDAFYSLLPRMAG